MKTKESPEWDQYKMGDKWTLAGGDHVEAWKQLYWYRLLVGSVYQCLCGICGDSYNPEGANRGL